MSAFIKLNKQDAFVAPYTAHKSYAYSTNQTRIDAGIRFRLGTRFTGSREDNITNLNRFYSSVKQLYYSNYSSSLESGSFENYNQSTLHFTRSLGDNLAIISIPQFLYGENIKPGTFEFNSGSVFHITDDGEGNLFASGAVTYSQVVSSSDDVVTTNFQATESIGYQNIPQNNTMNLAVSSTAFTGSLVKLEWTGRSNTSPFFRNSGNEQITIVSESAELNQLRFLSNTQLNANNVNVIQFQDTSATDRINFYFESSSQAVTSVDHEIYPSVSIADGEYLGNIFYSHGMAVLSKSNIAKRFQEQVLRSGSLEWKGSQTIFEHTYQCRSNQSQLNFTQNPSSYTNAPESGSIAGNITGSYFQPYITAVGLYNDTNELIAVGKLGQPVPKSQHTDMTFVIKFDV